MSEWLDKLHEGAVEIDCVVAYLNNLSNGFEMIGNMTMAQKLYRYSEKLQKAAKAIRSGAGEAVTEQLNRSQKFANNMLLATFASSAQTLEATGHKKKAQDVAKTGLAITGKRKPKRPGKKTSNFFLTYPLNMI